MAEFSLWHHLVHVGAATPQAAQQRAVVMAQLGNGDPLLVAAPYGNGMVVQCATGANAEWSNMPSRGFFLPLMQQVVTFLAARVSPPRNVAAGEPIVALIDRDQAYKQLTAYSIRAAKSTWSSRKIAIAGPW